MLLDCRTCTARSRNSFKTTKQGVQDSGGKCAFGRIDHDGASPYRQNLNSTGSRTFTSNGRSGASDDRSIVGKFANFTTRLETEACCLPGRKETSEPRSRVPDQRTCMQYACMYVCVCRLLRTCNRAVMASTCVLLTDIACEHAFGTDNAEVYQSWAFP